MAASTEPLWQPSESRRNAAVLTRFVDWVNRTRGLQLQSFEALWQWSVDDLEAFWSAVWDFFDVRQSAPHERVLADDRMPGAKWFPGARLSFVDQVFRHATPAAPAIIYESEAIGRGAISWECLQRQVADLAVTLRNAGVQPGDRVVAYLPNIPQTVIAFLAVASVGAIWSLCSPEMGVGSVTERFRQVEPKVLLTVDGYRFGGRWFDRREQVADVLAALPSVATVIQISLLDSQRDPPPSSARHRSLQWSEAIAAGGEWTPLQVPFDHPLWIVYSSGTTGIPKAIVHGHGGTLAAGLVSMGLHFDLEAADRYLWYSSTSWIMWNVQVMGLLVGATICLYDGAVGGTSPPSDLMTLWRFAAERRVDLFGAGAAYFAACLKAGLRPGGVVDLTGLQSLGSTGSPLSSECYRWVYDAVKRDVWLLSVSGGTDIAGAFVNGSPTLPVYDGELQCRNLGAAVYAFNELGEPVYEEVGELVCTRPMPSMPINLWGDEGGERYRDAYFDTFRAADGTPIWRHGDWIELTRRPEAVGAIIYGRSDATINRSGIRMGTAELYNVIEAHPDIVDSLVIDLEYLGRPSWLGAFVVMRAGQALGPALVNDLKSRIATALSARHVPDEILQVPAIPRTLTGKKLEVPIKKLLLGNTPGPVANAGVLSNPESLKWFVDFASLLSAKIRSAGF